jgi:hypothetical protein
VAAVFKCEPKRVFLQTPSDLRLSFKLLEIGNLVAGLVYAIGRRPVRSLSPGVIPVFLGIFNCKLDETSVFHLCESERSSFL